MNPYKTPSWLRPTAVACGKRGIIPPGEAPGLRVQAPAENETSLAELRDAESFGEGTGEREPEKVYGVNASWIDVVELEMEAEDGDVVCLAAGALEGGGGRRRPVGDLRREELVPHVEIHWREEARLPAAPPSNA